MGHVLFVHSSDSPVPPVFLQAQSQGDLEIVRQDGLTDTAIMAAAGLITCASVDQIDLHQRKNALETLLAAGGRIVLSCQIQRPFINGIENFIPIERPKRSDYVLTRLSEHPIFHEIDAKMLEKRHGVAGFYGRGYNPLPRCAMAITGLGPKQLPVDWEWHRPTGGSLFVHAGNDLWVLGDDPTLQKQIARRLIEWCDNKR